MTDLDPARHGSGSWQEPSFVGSTIVVVDGREFEIPDGATITQRVSSGKVEFGHVELGDGRRVVLTRWGEMVEGAPARPWRWILTP